MKKDWESIGRGEREKGLKEASRHGRALTLSKICKTIQEERLRNYVNHLNFIRSIDHFQ